MAVGDDLVLVVAVCFGGCLSVVCRLFAFVAVFALFDIYIETNHMYILLYRSNRSNWAIWSNLGKCVVTCVLSQKFLTGYSVSVRELHVVG